MGKLTVILGGARSGKSIFAEKMAESRSQNVLYIATAGPDDPEMKLRIHRHQQQRPEHWATLEQQKEIAAGYRALSSPADLVLLDCVTVLTSNVILEAAGSLENPDELAAEEALKTEIESLLELIAGDPADWILVTNEVGSGLVPPYPVGRIYRDLLGWANKRLTAESQECYLTISGKILDLNRLAVDLDTFFSDDS